MFRKASLFVSFMLLLTLVGCSSGSTTPPLAAKTPSPSSIVSLVLSPTSTPAPVFPTNCPASHLPGVKFFSRPTSLPYVGRFPVWGEFPQDLKIVGSTSSDYEPGTKIVWEVGPHFSLSVTIQVTNLATHKLAGWGNGQSPPMTFTNKLTPNNPEYHGHLSQDINEWGSFVYLPTAGCYQMHVTWQGGAWSVIFSVAIENSQN